MNTGNPYESIPLRVTVTTTFEVDPTIAHSAEWRETITTQMQALGATATNSEIHVDLRVETPEDSIEQALNQSLTDLLTNGADTSETNWHIQTSRRVNALSAQGITTPRHLIATGISALHDVPQCSDISVAKIREAVAYAGLSDICTEKPDMQNVARYCSLVGVPSFALGANYTTVHSIRSMSVGELANTSLETLAIKLGEWDVATKEVIPNYDSARQLSNAVCLYVAAYDAIKKRSRN